MIVVSAPGALDGQLSGADQTVGEQRWIARRIEGIDAASENEHGVAAVGIGLFDRGDDAGDVPAGASGLPRRLR